MKTRLGVIRWGLQMALPWVLLLTACSASSASTPGGGAGGSSGAGPGAGGPGAAGGVGQAGGVAAGGAPSGFGGATHSTGGAPPGSGGSARLDAGASGGGSPAYAADAGYAYDLSVTFDWPESTSQGTCKAGHYSGSFAGLYASSWTVVGAPIPVAGNLSLTLEASPDGEFFEISGGSLCGLADGLFPFSADISGTLDCKTGKLVDSKLENGGYWFGIAVGPPAGTFDGPLPGTYDKLSHSFTGMWKVYEPDSSNPATPYGGNGDWNASLGAATAASQAGCVGDAGAP